MDFEGDIIDYTLREMLNIMFSFMSFSDLTRKSFREKKFTNLKLNLLKSSDDEKILGSAPENDTFKIDFHVSELEEKKHLINNLELKSEKSFDNEKILKQIQGDRIERFLQYMQNYD
ncbi:MAG: hypothetical protein LBD88_01970 [Candidatus Peribacteria bacterium]|jgi:hypothetical protein|nr:hypothetical protein [Candidatus Peribacteria bacterium]